MQSACLVLVHFHIQPRAQLCGLDCFCHPTAIGQEAHRHLGLLTCRVGSTPLPWSRLSRGSMQNVTAVGSTARLELQHAQRAAGLSGTPPGWYSFASARLAAGSTSPPRISTPSMSNTKAGGPSGLPAWLLRHRKHAAGRRFCSAVHEAVCCGAAV